MLSGIIHFPPKNFLPFLLTLTLRDPETVKVAVGPTVVSAEKKAMAYTVKQLAAMSGVSVRTLHFYDETAC